MRNTLISTILFTLLLVSIAHGEQAHVLKVRDGDSVLIEVRGIRTDARLIGIDAPEWKQEYGKEAKAFVKEFCSHGSVSLEYDMDRYGPFNRLQVYIWKNGLMLNAEIVRAGLALASPYKSNKKHNATIKKAQGEAMAAKAGFWAQGGLKVTPKTFRKNH